MSSYICGSCTIRINDAIAEEIIDVSLLCGRVCESDESGGLGPCQRCVDKRCWRIAKEIEAERSNGSGRLRWVLVDESGADRIRDGLRRWTTRYRRLPLRDGIIFVFEDDHRVRGQVNPLAEDEDELKEWIRMVCRTPKGSRMSGTRTRKDKETGETLSASWGYPKPRPAPVEGRTSAMITLPSTMLKAYNLAGGAVMADWHGQVNEYGKTRYLAPAENQEDIMEILDLQGHIPHSDEPIFDTSGTDHWEV